MAGIVPMCGFIICPPDTAHKAPPHAANADISPNEPPKLPKNKSEYAKPASDIIS